MNIVLGLTLAVAALHSEPGPNTSLVATLGKEGIGMPGVGHWGLGGPFQPAFSLGADVHLLERTRWLVFSDVSLGVWIHRDVHQALFLQAAVGVRWRAPFGLEAEGLLGAGYLHAFDPRPTLGFAAGGGLTPTTTAGRPRFLFDAAVGLGWGFTAAAVRWTVFSRYHFLGELPFASGLPVPLMGHSILELGLRVPLALLVGGPS